MPKPVLDNPVGSGWLRNAAGMLTPVLYEGSAAPIEVRNFIHLYCIVQIMLAMGGLVIACHTACFAQRYVHAKASVSIQR